MGLTLEAQALPQIAPQLPLPIPVPRWIGQPTPDYNWPFSGYEFLSGRPVPSLRLTPEQRRKAAVPLAEFLATLHAVDASSIDVPGDNIGRADLEKRIPQLLTRLVLMREKGLVADTSHWEEIANEIPLDLPRPPNRLVHGDLSADHVLVDDSGLPRGVIDWGDVHVGHPGLDLSIVFSLLPPEGRKPFWDAYGKVDEPTEAMARFRALHGAALRVVYGDDIGNADLVREGLLAMDFVLQF